MKGVLVAVLALAVAACGSGPDPTIVNAPAAWSFSFTTSDDLPETQFPDRTVHLPDGAGDCDPGCTCDYEPALTADGGAFEPSMTIASFTETCPTHSLRCDINFESDTQGGGSCNDTDDQANVLGTYTLSLVRVSSSTPPVIPSASASLSPIRR
jgi:hypothetical protein